MPDGIPLFITGAFDIMSVDELELGVMSGTPGCNIPEPVGGVTETGGVFIVELPCAPGACYNNKLVISDTNTSYFPFRITGVYKTRCKTVFTAI